MDTRRNINRTGLPVALSVSFTFDNTGFMVATEDGVRFYDTEKPFQVSHFLDLDASVSATELLDDTNIMAMIGGGGRRQKYAHNTLVFWDLASIPPMWNLKIEFAEVPKKIRLSGLNFVVVFAKQVYLYGGLPVIPRNGREAQYDTAHNPYGLCCFRNGVVVFPGRTAGQAQIVRMSDKSVRIIPAHSSPLSALELSQDGTLLATASEQGTLVRVWSTIDSSKLAEVRRGIDQAVVFSLAFNPTATMLAITSDKSTLHIFNLVKTPDVLDKGEEAEGASNKWGPLSKLPFMPRVFSDTYSDASVPFVMGQEPTSATMPASNIPHDTKAGRRPPKGLIGWLNDDTLAVISAGHDARWELFKVGKAEDGSTRCWRDGWRHYMRD